MHVRPLTSWQQPITILLLGYAFLWAGNERLIAKVPLYTLEYLYLIVIFLSLLSLTKDQIETLWKKRRALVLIGVLLASSAIGLYVNNPTLTTLGKYVSWLLLPSLASLGAFLSVSPAQAQRQILNAGFWGGGVFLFFVSISLLWGDFTYDQRLLGGMPHPNALGYMLVMYSIFFVSKFVGAEKKEKYLSFFFMLVTFVYLWLTQSYGSWLAFLPVGVYLSWYFLNNTSNKKEVQKSFLLLALLGTVLFGFLLMQTEKFQVLVSGAERSSLSSRLMIWQSATVMLGTQPLQGIGVGNFQKNYLTLQPLFPPYLEWAVPEPHNLFLATWLSFGFVGMLVFWGIYVEVFRQAWRLWKKQKQPMFILFLITTFLYGLFDTPLLGNAQAFVFWIPVMYLLLSQESR